MKKIIKNKKINLFNVLVFIFVLIYVIFGTDVIKDIKNNVASVSNVTNNNESVKLQDNVNLEVYFLDVGQADSILIKLEDEYMLIDAGNNEDGVKLVNYFNELGIKEFKYVFGTHPHEDHIGGMDDIITNFKIDNYYMPDKITTTKTFEDVLDALINNNLQYAILEKGDEFNLSSANFKVIYAGDETNDINDSSIVLKLTYGNNSFLLTGDATSNVEKTLLNDNIKSDVLKVAHHGSNYSSTEEFLDVVSPKYAVISVGKNNSYNHPSNSTLKKLNDRNIKLYRTDLDGTIKFTSDGENITITTISTDVNG